MAPSRKKHRAAEPEYIPEPEPIPSPVVEAKKPVKRDGKPIHVWVDDAIYDAVEKFRTSQRLPSTLKDTVELALLVFLKSEGLWPKGQKPE